MPTKMLRRTRPAILWTNLNTGNGYSPDQDPKKLEVARDLAVAQRKKEQRRRNPKFFRHILHESLLHYDTSTLCQHYFYVHVSFRVMNLSAFAFVDYSTEQKRSSGMLPTALSLCFFLKEENIINNARYVGHLDK